MDLNSSLEWRILQHLGFGVVGRLARKGRSGRTPTQSGGDAEAPPTRSIAFENNLAFLETELRSVVKWRVPRTIPLAAYDNIQPKFQRLCGLLEKLVNWPLATSDQMSPTFDEGAPKAAGVEQGSAQPQPLPPYSGFRALLRYLDDRSGGADTFALDMAKGPNPTLFLVQNEDDAKAALDAANECNEALVWLCKNPEDSGQHTVSPSRSESTASTEAQLHFHQRMNDVLSSLFGSFCSCRETHEILLQLSDQTDDGHPNPLALNMFLPCCSHPGAWQEAECLPYTASFPVDHIQDICHTLDRWTRCQLFQILHEHRGLFQALNDIPPISSLSIASEQSLRQYIENGAFLRGDRDNNRPAEFFGPREKQILALKLARCLSGFFDSETTSPSWDSEKVYLITPPGSRLKDGLLYLPFAPGNIRSPAFTIGFADPVLLAFAKLLLEIDLGAPIDLSQCQSREQQWGVLCQQAFNSERGGSGLFAEAVKGCLYLHLELRGKSDDEHDRAFLRRIIQDKVVSHLELALNPPTASKGKRQREGDDNDWTKNSGMESHDEWKAVQNLAPITAPFSYRLPKRQRIDMAEQRGRERPCDNTPPRFLPPPTAPNELPARRPRGRRMTVFRAREVPSRGQISISETVTNILMNNIKDSDKEYSRFVVKDISGRKVAEGGERGTALVFFRGLVPEPLEAVLRSREDSDLFSNYSDDEEDLSMDLDTKFIGATQLYEPPPNVEIVADIIAIHGLNGHPYGSWVSKSAKPRMWLSDFLHEDAKNCRIIIYGYKSNIFDDQEHPRHELFSQAERLRATLKNVRNTPELEKRPIIFVAHSYGGLVLARTLIEDQTKQAPLLWATKALFLFACPSRGFYVRDILDTIQAEREANGQEPIPDDKAEALVRRLGEGDFRNELASYANVIVGKKVYSFIETRRTETVTRQSGAIRRDGPSVLAAPPNSVIIGLPSAAEEVIFTDKDHSDIVKFASRGDATYQDVKHRIQAEISSIMNHLDG